MTSEHSLCKVLGFDPGFASLGVGAVWLTRDNQLLFSNSALIRTSPEDSEVVRFGQIATRLEEILRSWCYFPSGQPGSFEVWAGYEGQRFAGRGRGGANAASSVGLILGVLGKAEDLQLGACEEVAPREMKRIVAGSGVAGKDEVYEGLDRLLARDDYGCLLSDLEEVRGTGFSRHEIDALGIAAVMALRARKRREAI